jgi:hypothetical protein
MSDSMSTVSNFIQARIRTALFCDSRVVLHALVDVVLDAGQLELSANVTQQLLFWVA